MTADEAVALLAALATSVADWQRAADTGRRTKAPERAAKHTRRLFLQLTGAEPTDGQVAAVLDRVGLV